MIRQVSWFFRMREFQAKKAAGMWPEKPAGINIEFLNEQINVQKGLQEDYVLVTSDLWIHPGVE